MDIRNDILWDSYHIGNVTVTLGLELTVSRNVRNNNVNVTLKYNGDIENGDECGHKLWIEWFDGVEHGSTQFFMKTFNSGNTHYEGTHTFTATANTYDAGTFAFNSSFVRTLSDESETGSWSVFNGGGAIPYETPFVSRTKYTVTYDKNGGKTKPSSQNKYYGVAINLANAISRDDSVSTITSKFNGNGASNPSSLTNTKTVSYSFSKWEATNGTRYNAGASYSANASTEMTAVWTSSTAYTSITLPSPTRSGYSLNGWYTASSGGTLVGAGGASVSPTSSKTYYAQWTALGSDISYASNVTAGGNITVKWSPNSSSYSYKLTFGVGSWTYTTSVINPASTSEYTYTYTVPMSVCSQLPTSTSGTISVTLKSYSGNTEIGTSSVNKKVYVPTSVVPVFTHEIICSNDILTPHLIGTEGTHDSAKYTQLSTFSLSATATPQYGAYPVSVKVTGESLTKSFSFTNNSVSGSLGTLYGNTDLNITVTDSRGRTSTQTAHVSLSNRNFTVSGSASASGTDTFTATFTASVNVSTLADSIHPSDYIWNVPTLTIKKKKLSTGVITTVKTYSALDGTLVNGTNNITYSELIDGESHEIYFELSDSYGTSTKQQTLYINGFDYSEDNYYVGMKFDGTKSASTVSGTYSDGTATITKSDGSDFAGIGIPIKVNGSRYFWYRYDVSGSSNAKAYVSYFSGVTSPHSLISKTELNGYNYLVGVPENTEWVIVTFGINGNDSVNAVFSNIMIYSPELQSETLSIDWLLETGVIGLSTPNTKYISRLQLRADYTGTFNLAIAYEGEDYNVVMTKSSDIQTFKSINIPINVRRHDRFRMKLFGSGAMKLYSIGFILEEGSELC